MHFQRTTISYSSKYVDRFWYYDISDAVYDRDGTAKRNFHWHEHNFLWFCLRSGFICCIPSTVQCTHVLAWHRKKTWKKKKKTARILVGCSHKRDACWRMCFTWHNSHKLHHHHHHHQHHMVKRLYRNPYIDLVRNDIELIICRSNWEKLTTTKKKKKLEKKRQPTSQT